MFSKLKYIKTKSTYYNFIRYIFIKFFNFFWIYIINLKGRLLYIDWKKNFNSNEILFDTLPKEVQNENFKKFSKNLFPLLDKSLIENFKKKVINNEIIEDSANLAANEKPFSIDLYPYLDTKIKHMIVELAADKTIIDNVCNYLQTFPILAKVMVYLNIPREESVERSSMLWHKDEFGYKSVDLFMALEKIDDTNGPFYYSTNPGDIGAFYRIKTENPLARPGERGKISNNDFLKYVEKDHVKKFTGDMGSTIFIDSMSSYHKGGYCLNNDRLMLRFSYQTPDCTRLKKQVDKKFYYLGDVDKINLPTKFKNYLFFYRSFILNQKIKEILLKFYRMISVNPQKLN
jgi:hypothetical protein